MNIDFLLRTFNKNTAFDYLSHLNLSLPLMSLSNSEVPGICSRICAKSCHTLLNLPALLVH